METVVQFFDVVDEFIVAAVDRLRRTFSPRARERRAVYRGHPAGNEIVRKTGHTDTPNYQV